MASASPSLVVLGGPNGAGKSTAAPYLLRDELAVFEFVNADVIAQGLSGFGAEGAALAAGRILLERIEELARKRSDFAFESTLASRMLASRIVRFQATGYRFHLVVLWLSSADMAVARVHERIRQGGHAVPEETIRRRYRRGSENMFQTYLPLADAWRFYDNSRTGGPQLIARGGRGITEEVIDATTWIRARSRE